MNKQEQVANSILRPLNPTIVIILGVFTVTWGLWLISPFWTVFTQAPIYSAMMELMPEKVWGAFAVTAGGFIIRGALQPNSKNLLTGSFIGFFYWLVVAIMYFMGDWTATGGLSAATFSIYSALVWLNIRVNRDHYDNMNS